jgi:ABC-type Fe3+ transport system permease subunit
MKAQRMPNRIPRLIGGLMLAEAVTFAIASIAHFGVLESFIGAAIPEAIIAVVLGAGAIAVLRRPAGSWWLALTTTLFALAGVIIGLSVILRGRVSRPYDLAYHASIFVALVITVSLLLTPMVRRVLRPS